MRIQFDITVEEAESLLPFILDIKYRHFIAHKALIEWISRQEGNLKRRKGNIDPIISDVLKRQGVIK